MAETVGSLVDKLSIVELRRWHTEEVMLNPTAPDDLRHDCALRLRIIDEQRRDLMAELSTLWMAIVEGRHVPKVYRQLKMYNDDTLRTASDRASSPTAPPTDEPAHVIPLRRA